MKNLIFGTLLVVCILSIIAALYSIVAGLWGFNPFEIPWFNTKVLVTSLLSAFTTFILSVIWAKLDD